jgi:type I restriction enzyme S subunit
MRDGWAETTLDEVAIVVNGSTPATKEPTYWGGDIPWITTTELTACDDGYVTSSFRSITSAAIKSGGARVVRSGATLLGTTATIGTAALTLVDTSFNQQISGLLPKSEKVLDEFLFFWVRGNRLQLDDLSAGTSFKRISTANLKNLRCVLPPLVEQKRIVDVLTSVDAYIDALQQQVCTARNARDAVLHELLSAAGGDWTETTLGDISDTRLGKMLSATTDDGSGALHPYLRNANVRWGEVDFSDLKEMRFSQRDCETFSLLAGDLLICEGGEPGRTALLKKDLPGIYFQKAIHRVRCKQGLEPEFLEYWMRHLTVSGLLDDFLTSTTIQHLTGEKLRQLPVLLPSMDEQLRIVNAVSSIAEVIQSTEQAVFMAKTLRSGLLSDLLSGEHEIPASYDSLLGAA